MVSSLGSGRRIGLTQREFDAVWIALQPEKRWFSEGNGTMEAAIPGDGPRFFVDHQIPVAATDREENNEASVN